MESQVLVQVVSSLRAQNTPPKTVMATAEASTAPSSSTVVSREHPMENIPPSHPLRNALRQIVAGGSAGKAHH